MSSRGKHALSTSSAAQVVFNKDHLHGDSSLTLTIAVQANFGNLHAHVPYVKTRALIITLHLQNTDYKAFATIIAYTETPSTNPSTNPSIHPSIHPTSPPCPRDNPSDYRHHRHPPRYLPKQTTSPISPSQHHHQPAPLQTSHPPYCPPYKPKPFHLHHHLA